MNRANSSHLWRYAIFNLVILALIAAWFWQQNQPVKLAEPLLADGKLQCLSYAPYYGEGQTPFIKGTHISQVQIENDLKFLAEHSNCVRIYSVNQGLDYVPVAASKIGLKVLLGAWIGWVDSENIQEINLATRLANQYPDTITGLIIGNEVLLRGEQTEAALAEYIKLAKQSTKIPVTYADVWEYWLKHPALESSVDFVTVHVLPYWEDDPQPVGNAIHHVNVVMDKVTHAFKKPVMIGETGWPSVGRHRNASVPSTVNQARYMREFLLRAEEANWNYNIIEAVDQPWKRFLEGAVGGYWGLFDTNLNPKFPFSGLMSERNDGLKPLYWALSGLLIWLAIAYSAGERHTSALVGSAALGASAGLMALLQLGYLVIACRDIFEWIGLGSLNILGILTVLAISLIVAKNQVPAIDAYKSTIRISVFIFTLCAAIAGFLLMPKALVLKPLSESVPQLSGFLYNLDGRYRDFPLTIYLLPVLQLSIGLWLAQLRTLTNTTSRIYCHLNTIALVTIIIFILSEPLNVQAYVWFGLVVLLMIISWPKRRPTEITEEAES
jgi:exo-beta-1,3-glucanase (GH17 family)